MYSFIERYNSPEPYPSIGLSHISVSSFSLALDKAIPMIATTNMTIIKMNEKMQNGIVKQHFFHLAAQSPRRPTKVTKIPTMIASIPKRAYGDGIF
jgi:hypothetical protein